VPGVDGLFTGPSDLAVGFGHRGHPEHEEVQETVTRVAESDLNTRRGNAGKPLRITLHSRDNVAIVVNASGLPVGTTHDDGLTLTDHVPQGHKVAIVD